MVRPLVICRNARGELAKSSSSLYSPDLLQSKMAAPRAENKAPIRAFRSQETKDKERLVARQSNIGQPTKAAKAPTAEQLLTAVMKSSKKGSAHNFVASKKLLKSPNYKIYGSRRFGSSASSSSASIFHRYDKQRKNRSHQTVQINYLLRSFGSLGTSTKNLGLNPAVAKYLVPERNQHIQHPLGSLPQAMEISSNIQRDLMVIDNTLKDRISLAKTRIAKLTASLDRAKDTAAKPKDAKEALRGWNHPNAADLFISRFHEGGVATAHLQEQNRKLAQVNRSNENRDKQTTNSFVFGGEGKKRTRVSENLNAMLGDLAPRQNIPHHVVTKLETPLDRMPTRRFTSRKALQSAANAPPSEAPNNTMATPTSLLVAEVEASRSIGMKNGRYNRSHHYNRRY